MTLVQMSDYSITTVLLFEQRTASFSVLSEQVIPRKIIKISIAVFKLLLIYTFLQEVLLMFIVYNELRLNWQCEREKKIFDIQHNVFIPQCRRMDY